MSDTTAEAPEKKGVTEEPILDLDALSPKRPTIRIKTKQHPEGKLYELKLLQDFGVEEAQKLQAQGREFDDLWSSGSNLSATDGQRMKMLLDDMFEKVLDAPKVVRDQLNDGLRSQVVMAFTLAPLAMSMAAQVETEEKMMEEDRQTTEN